MENVITITPFELTEHDLAVFEVQLYALLAA